MRRVVVTGLGAITPLGVGARTSWKRLIAGESGISSLKSQSKFNDIPSQVAGLVPRGPKDAGGWSAEDWLGRSDVRQMALFAQYAYAAAQEAIDDAGIPSMKDDDRAKIGVNIGSGIGSLEDVVSTTLAYDNGGYRKVSPLFIPRLLINLAAGHISMKHGFLGPSLSPSTACTTGSHAIGDAFNLIRYSKQTPMMLAGAAESCIEPLALAGFSRARSLSTQFNDQPEISSRPFDERRDGFVIAEGAAVLVLEELEHARDRGADIYAEIVGYGLASDAHHVTAPHPSGRGAFLSMKSALQDAEIAPKEVDYVNAHATGTILGDLAENRAIRQIMLDGPDGKANPIDVNVSSVKGAVGHLLGAAGALEGMFSALAVKEDVLPPTINLDQLGDKHDGWDMNYVANKSQHRSVDIALSNSFGFGGTCASLCFKKFKN